MKTQKTDSVTLFQLLDCFSRTGDTKKDYYLPLNSVDWEDSTLTIEPVANLKLRRILGNNKRDKYIVKVTCHRYQHDRVRFCLTFYKEV